MNIVSLLITMVYFKMNSIDFNMLVVRKILQVSQLLFEVRYVLNNIPLPKFQCDLVNNPRRVDIIFFLLPKWNKNYMP